MKSKKVTCLTSDSMDVYIYFLEIVTLLFSEFRGNLEKDKSRNVFKCRLLKSMSAGYLQINLKHLIERFFIQILLSRDWSCCKPEMVFLIAVKFRSIKVSSSNRSLASFLSKD
jgi:hypothetical protein